MRSWAGRVVCVCSVAGISSTTSSAKVDSHQSSCPIAGQCGVNSTTRCPTLGSLQPTAPRSCVPIPASTFKVSGQGAGGGCNSDLIVQVEPQKDATHLRHGTCCHLISQATRYTYAHAARCWSNA